MVITFYLPDFTVLLNVKWKIVILKACAKKKLSCKLIHWNLNFEMKEHKFEKRKNLERLFWNDNIRHLA